MCGLPADRSRNGESRVLENFLKSYGDTVAVDDVSFAVAPGEIFGILGRSGAGKTAER